MAIGSGVSLGKVQKPPRILLEFRSGNESRVGVASPVDSRLIWDLTKGEAMNFMTKYLADLVSASAFLADQVTVLGDVTIGDESSIWFGAVIRGDTEQISIGERSNVQDLSVLHADPGYPCRIGDRVTVGHGAVVHGATVEDDVMIGMRAVLLNGAVIGSGSMIAAGAVVTEGTIIPPGSFVAGIPAKVRGTVTPRHTEMIAHAANHYVAAGKAYAES